MKALRIVLVGLALCVLALVGWRARPVASRAAAAEPAPLAALGRAMRSGPGVVRASLPGLAAPTPPRDEVGPEYAPFFDRLRAEFPRGAAAAAGAPPDERVWSALRDVEQGEGVLAADAGPAALERMFAARAAVLDALAPLSARSCADFVYGEVDGPALLPFTAAHRALVAGLAERTLDAVAEGRGRARGRAAPTEADLDALSAGLAARGLTPEEVAALMDGAAPDPAPPDARLCAMGQAYLAAMHDLPAEARERLYGLAAELLARS